MDKKSFILLFALLTTLLASTPSMAGGPFPLDIVPPPSNGNGDGPGRDQHPSIYVNIDNHVLSFDNTLAGYTIDLLDGETIVFTDAIDENGLVYIPGDIYGLFKLQITIGENTYQGEIYIE